MLLMKIKNSKVIFPDKNKYKIEYSDEIVDLINQVSIWNIYFKLVIAQKQSEQVGLC